MSARQVSPLTSTAERELLEELATFNEPMSRRQMYNKFGADHFVDEEDLAKALGRMVADGRLQKEMRQGTGPRGTEEAVYFLPGSRVQTSAQAPEPKPASPPAEASGRGRRVNEEKILAHLEAHGDWITQADLARAIDRSTATVSIAARGLLEDKKIQSLGAGRGLRYAALGLAIAVEREQPRKPAARNLAELGAPLPVPAPTRPEPTPGALVTRQRPTGKVEWVLGDNGTVAIVQGHQVVVLSPPDLEYGVKFLENTQPVWRGRKAAA